MKADLKSRSGIVLAIAAVLLAAPATGSAKMEPAVRACAFGKLPSALKRFLPGDLAIRERHFAARQPASDRARSRRLFSAAATAYVYAMPSVLERLTVAKYPVNIITAIADLAKPESRTVVAPNHDTFYFVSHVDLSKGPLILDAPATGGRYSVVQLLDAWTDVVGYVGSGKARNHAERVAIVPPGWTGTLPDGVRELRSDSNLVWLLGRTLVDGESDRPAARAVLASYALTPLADWIDGQRKHALVLDRFPVSITQPVLPAGIPFLDAAASGLGEDSPRRADACAVKAFSRAGVAPGRVPSETTDPVRRRALAAGAKAGDALVDDAADRLGRASRSRHNGWWFNTGNVARFGTSYVRRAVIARIALASNRPSETIYPTAEVDSRGRKLSGAHRYVITFPAGELPPVRAFWSLTLYDPEVFLVDNPIDRYAIGDRTPGLRRGTSGALKIYVQHHRPAGAKAANWLPAPTGRFSLYLRLYEPKKAATDGGWKPPSVVRK